MNIWTPTEIVEALATTADMRDRRGNGTLDPTRFALLMCAAQALAAQAAALENIAHQLEALTDLLLDIRERQTN